MTAHPRLIYKSPPQRLLARRPQERFQCAKISQAIEDEVTAGGMIEGLRPVEKSAVA